MYRILAFSLDLLNTKKCNINDLAFINKLASNIFGMFAGVTRSTAHRIKTWPEDIHGSIGYWNNAFNVINNPLELCEHTFRVAKDAMQSDERRKYFPNILTDVNAIFDVKFMKLPVYKIDGTTGKFIGTNVSFNNDKYGLIVQSNGRRATYLPGVFPNIKWNKIKEYLLQKASITNDNVIFVAYEVERYHIKIADYYYTILKTKESALFSYLACNFVHFIENSIGDMVPFSVDKTKHVEVNPDEDVRNVGTLVDIKDIIFSLCQTRILSDKSIKLLHKTALYYLKKYKNSPDSLRQASTFLLSLLRIEEDHGFDYKTEIEDIETYLYSKLNLMEVQFELGEALTALQANYPTKEQQHILDHYFTLLRDPLNIFELNWQAQFLKTRQIAKAPHPQETTKRHKLLKQLLELVKAFDIMTETNYIAVAFEALCVLNPDDTDYLASLFNQLMERCDVERGLFMFINGTSRIDISGHIYRGMINLYSQ